MPGSLKGESLLWVGKILEDCMEGVALELGPKNLGWEGDRKEIHLLHAGTIARAKF